MTIFWWFFITFCYLLQNTPFFVQNPAGSQNPVFQNSEKVTFPKTDFSDIGSIIEFVKKCRFSRKSTFLGFLQEGDPVKNDVFLMFFYKFPPDSGENGSQKGGQKTTFFCNIPNFEKRTKKGSQIRGHFLTIFDVFFDVFWRFFDDFSCFFRDFLCFFLKNYEFFVKNHFFLKKWTFCSLKIRNEQTEV